MLLIIIIVGLLCIGGGAFGHTRYGYGSWSPLGILLVVVLCMMFLGYIRL